MITNGIIRFFKALIGGVVKVTAWLLFALGLWLPSLYAIVFLIVCAFTATSFVSVLQSFIVGLVLSAIAGFVISYYIDKRKRKDKETVRMSAREERRQRKLREKEERRAQKTDTEEIREEDSTSQSRNTYAGYEADFAVGEVSLPLVGTPSTDEGRPEREEKETAPEKFDEDYENEMKRKYFDSEIGGSYDGYDYESAAKKKLDMINNDDSRPLVFRSRNDKNIYIYEFEDRLQIYRRTSYGMQLIEVRPKDKSRRV